MGWAALSELVPLYPLYALLFLDTGLSAADVSLLFAAWSVAALLTEVPAGALADRWSRRGALVLGGVLEAAAFVVWTVAPQFWGFLAGFVVWGVAGALVSGTFRTATRRLRAISSRSITCSARTLLGPEPKRPSRGSRSAGIEISGAVGTRRA